MHEKLSNKLFPLIIILSFGWGLAFLNTGTPPKSNKSLEISFLDVGQGDSVLLKTPSNKYYLIDGGPDKKVVESIGNELPLFNQNFAGIFLTHPHADHLAGLNYVLDKYHVDKIYLTGAAHTSPDYAGLLQRIEKYKLPTERFIAGNVLVDGETKISAIWPPENIEYKDLNDTSMVLKLEYKETDALFLGDLSAEKQTKILPQVEETEIMKVSHHGSKTGTSPEVQAQAQPKYSVISVGKNRFGHPSSKTIQLLIGSIIFRTDQNGTVRFSSNGKDIFVF